ncbi:MAG: hypothetical protein ABJJ53_00295 [Sulfitobacter sp.]
MKHLATVLALLPLAATADVTTPQGRTIDCYCTDTSGARIELGESICLQVDGRMFTAQCQMSLNVPMWRETREGCIVSQNNLISSPLRFHPLQQPVQTLAIHPKI